MAACNKCFWCEQCASDEACEHYTHIDEDEHIDEMIEENSFEFYEEWLAYIGQMDE